MKKLFLFLFLISFFLVQGQSNQEINGHLIGHIKRSDFLDGKYLKWFKKNYEDYIPKKKIIQKIKKHIENISVKSFLGSWCHDSKRELPRFYKVMDLVGFDLNENFEMIGITRGKKTPDNLQKGFNIKHTPTFIFYKNGKEIGRYIEYSKISIEKDILKILR